MQTYILIESRLVVAYLGVTEGRDYEGALEGNEI